MDTYKLRWTRLQREIFKLLCIKVGTPLNQRTIANLLKVSPTAVSKSLNELKKENLIDIKKNQTMNLILIELNREDEKAINLKRIENLKMIYESGLVNYLEEKFPGTTIILFGSYSKGEDTIKSDIDIAVIGTKEKNINLEKFDKLFERDISLHFYRGWKEINKNLRNNMLNGVVLVGGVEI